MLKDKLELAAKITVATKNWLMQQSFYLFREKKESSNNSCWLESNFWWIGCQRTNWAFDKCHSFCSPSAKKSVTTSIFRKNALPLRVVRIIKVRCKGNFNFVSFGYGYEGPYRLIYAGNGEYLSVCKFEPKLLFDSETGAPMPKFLFDFLAETT